MAYMLTIRPGGGVADYLDDILKWLDKRCKGVGFKYVIEMEGSDGEHFHG